MATLVTCVVDPGGTGDYTSLNAAEADNFGATDADLVTNDEYVECTCKCTNGAADTTAVTINGQTTDATHDITISVPAAYRPSTTKFPESGNYYRIDKDGAKALTVNTAYVSIYNLFAQAKNLASSYLDGIYLSGDEMLLDGCVIVVDNVGATTQEILFCYNPSATSGATQTIRNCVVYATNSPNATLYAFRTSTAGGNFSVSMLNCTAIGGEYGFQRITGTLTAKNCVSFGASTGFFGTFDASSTNNASDQNDAPGSNALDLTGKTAYQVFADPDNDDYHLCSGSPLIDAGVDLSSTFTTDIDGDTRAVPWDIGADKFSPSGVGMIYIMRSKKKKKRKRPIVTGNVVYL